MISSLTKSTLRRFGVAAVFLLLFLTAPEPARGQEIDQTVARISHVSGPVSHSRGNDPDDWEAAVVNVPFTLGDRIYSPRDGLAELQLPAGNFVRLAPRTYFTALNLTHDVKQFYLGEGAASFTIRQLGPDEIFEVDTPKVAVTLEARGRYRVEVDEDGNSRVVVRRGRAIVAANGRQVTVEDAEIRVYGVDSPRYEIVALRNPDAFDRWVDERDDRFERAYAGAYQYVSDQVIGVEELWEHGRWEQIPEYGYVWTPERAPVGWQPYTVGYWVWQDPWGWTWISEEPWGWAPWHYGRWTFYRSRWYWVPVGPRVRVIRYAPALVVFVRVREHVGWFPVHPRDRFIPWWGPRVTVQNLTYVNRTHVVIVKQETFVSARRVTTNVVRESVVVREVTSARVMEHQLPVPTRSSLRAAAGRDIQRSHRPPAKVPSRPAVVRTAPQEPFFTNLPQRPERPERLPARPKQAGTPPSAPSKGPDKLREVQQGQRRQEQERQKQERQLQQQQREEQQRRELGRHQKAQEREHQKQEKQVQEQPRKQQQQLQKEQQRKQQLKRGFPKRRPN